MPGLKEKPGREPVRCEANNGLSNLRGTLSVARAANPDSGTTQFYINIKDNPFLDHTPARAGYAVFGKVVAGMEVIDRIRTVDTGSRGGHANVPTQDVVIVSVRRLAK